MMIVMRNARVPWLVARILAALGVVLGGYLLAALVGGAMPANRGWHQADRGVTVWVESNGIHTGLVMPKQAAGVDWRPLTRPRDLRDPRYGGWDYVAIGWGERGFYLGTPTWREFSPRVAMRAVTGSDETLMHVEHVPGPAPDARPIVLTPDEYRRLAGFVAGSFRPGGQAYPGYGRADAFYDARGRYDAVRTCNHWTGAALRHAGVRVGRWTPLPITVMWWF